MALAAKKDKASYKVCTLLGDGELAEGSNWESMMAAAHYSLDNLTAIIDRNNLQITGRTEDVCEIEPLGAKLTAFGWSVRIVDGHDITALTDVLRAAPFEAGKPSMIIAKTIKGKGVSFIENDHRWHHKVPSDEQYEQAQQELNDLLDEMKL